MALPAVLKDKLRLPAVGAPLFIVSNPKLVIAQCKAGIVGAFPALNARPAAELDEWLHEITEALAAHDRAHPEAPAAPFAVNQIVHKSNVRLEQDMTLTVKWQAPIVITSLGARAGLLIVNPPHTLFAEARALLPWLAELTAREGKGKAEVEWLTEPR